MLNDLCHCRLWDCPARSIVNRLMRALDSINRAAPEFPLATAAIAPLRAWGEAQGLGDFSPLWAGQNTGGCKAISVVDLTCELAKDAWRSI